MLFQGKVRVAFEEDDVLAHMVRGRHRFVGVAEFKRDRLVHV